MREALEARQALRLAKELIEKVARWPAGSPNGMGGKFKPGEGGEGGGSARGGRSRGLAQMAGPSLPRTPKFITSNPKVKAENEGHAKAMRDLAEKGDLDALKGYTAFSPKSQKLSEFKAALIAAVSVGATTSKPKAPMPDFKAELVPTSNVNAASHNAKVLVLEKYANEGATDKILGLSYGVNTYGKRQAKLANKVLEALGSDQKVVLGQKAGTHPAIGKTPPVAPPAPPKPTAPPAPPKPVAATKPAPAPAPKPDAPAAPKAGPATYKPAKKLEDAIAQLESFGMKVKRLSATYQSEENKQKIANAPDHLKAHYEKWYGPKKTKGYISDKSFLEVMNAIGPEAARLSQEFPALVKAVKLVQRSPGAKALGMYTMLEGVISLRKPSGFNVPKPLKEGEVPWTVSTGGLHSSEIRDTFRHEAGHAFDLGVHGKALTKELQNVAFQNKEALGHGMMNMPTANHFVLPNYVGKNFSLYGGTKATEATAELITLYTMEGYKPGTIAKPLEDVLEKYLKKSPVSKAVRRAEEDEDSDSISIPAPPEGYELVSADGIDIRFRAPDGKIVQYIDMVEQGLFGPEEDEE